MLGQNLRVIQYLFKSFDAVKDLNQPGLVIVEGTKYGRALQFLELRKLLVGAYSAAPVCHIKPGQRAYPVHTSWITHRLVISGLEIAVSLNLFAQIIEIACGIEAIGH